MFHWICPECGREIAPTVRECPVCDPNAIVAEPALVGVVEAPPARTLSDAAPPARTLSDAAPPARTLSDAAPPARIPSDAAPAARISDKPTPVAQILEPALPAVRRPNATARALPAPETVTQPSEPILPQLGTVSRGNPLEDLSALLDGEHDQEIQAAKVQESKPSDPPRSEQSFPIATPSPATPPKLRAWIAALGPAAEPSRSPLTGTSQSKPLAEPPLVRTKIALPPIDARNPGRRAVRHPDEPVAAISAPASKPADPVTPFDGPAPALAALTNYSPLAGRPMRPAVPSREVFKRDVGPRTTLPGPMLTSRLVKFQDRELNPILPERRLVRKRLIPGWAATVLIVGTVLVAGFNSIFSIVPRSGGDAKVSAGNDVEAASSSAVPAAPETNSLSKAIEVTGFRIQMDPAKKPEIQYLVVNHTANPFSGVTVYVTLHAAHEAPGQPPIGKFQFGAPDLKPYESKEMASAIERVNRPTDLPQWQDLRADVEIGQ
jgi:hypothetical protein